MRHADLPNRFRTLVELGEPVDVYAIARWKLTLMTVVSVPLLALAVASPFLAQTTLWGMGRNWYPAGLLGLMFGGLIGLLAWIRARNTIVVYEHGFAWARGGLLNVYVWEAITAMTSSVTGMRVNGIPAGTEQRHTLGLLDGDRIVLTNDNVGAGRVGQLAAHIDGQITPRLVAQHAEAYNRGEQLQFGPVTIGRSFGIQQGNKHMAWDEVESMDLREGQLDLRRRGGKRSAGMSIPVSTVPNFRVLYSLLARALGVEHLPE